VEDLKALEAFEQSTATQLVMPWALSSLMQEHPHRDRATPIGGSQRAALPPAGHPLSRCASGPHPGGRSQPLSRLFRSRSAEAVRPGRQLR
jgi:hypothetical protein